MKKIKVTFRGTTLSLFAEWYESQCESGFRVERVPIGFRAIFKLLVKHGKKGAVNDKRVDFERSELRKFVDSWVSTILEQQPSLLIQSEIPASDGSSAMAEIVLTMKRAIERGPGSPRSSIDPIDAFEADKAEQKNRLRNWPRSVKNTRPTLAKKYRMAGVRASRNTLDAAIREGRGASEVISGLTSALGPSVVPLFALVDYANKTIVMTAGVGGLETVESANAAMATKTDKKTR